MKINYQDINKRICDRTESWCWQTDRKISQDEVRTIWQDKHNGISNDELIKKANNELKGCKLVSIKEIDKDAQENLGFINSVRVGTLDNGKNVIIRCHPRGVKNGYFYVESLVSKKLKDLGLPAYNTYLIHDLQNENDCAFQIIEKIEGIAIKKWLEKHPEDTEKLTIEIGKMMRKMHALKVNGFGSFDNEQAKNGNLIGLHSSLTNFVMSGLENNLNTLIKYNVLTNNQTKEILNLFSNTALLQKENESILIHNDFVDWNLLTDGNTITGILDLDECAGATPFCDIASWSGMSSQERTNWFLQGYFEENKPSEMFEKQLKLISFRWIISNMALRNSRLEYLKDDKFLLELIEDGKKQLNYYLKYFNIGE